MSNCLRGFKEQVSLSQAYGWTAALRRCIPINAGTNWLPLARACKHFSDGLGRAPVKLGLPPTPHRLPEVLPWRPTGVQRTEVAAPQPQVPCSGARRMIVPSPRPTLFLRSQPPTRLPGETANYHYPRKQPPLGRDGRRLNANCSFRVPPVSRVGSILP